MAPRGRQPTVAELYGDIPRLKFDPSPLEKVHPEDIWVNYDEITDSLTLFITGEPVSGVYVWLQDDKYVIVDPETEKVVGIYVEAFEKVFVQEHEEIQEAWADVKGTFTPEEGWSQILRFLALWLALIFATVGLDPKPETKPQPA